jgi:predicted DNA-binding transcriptional regulator AlpA
MHEVAKNFGVSLATLYRHIPANPQEDEVEAFVEP